MGIKCKTLKKKVGNGQMTEDWGIRKTMPDSDQPISNTQKRDSESQVTLLVDKAREGNVIAFNQIMTIFQEDIFRMVYYRTRSQTDTEDITQDIFLKAYKNLPRLKDVNRFRSWLFRIAINRVRDFYRKKRLLNLFKDFSEDQDTYLAADVSEPPEAVDTLIKKEFWETIILTMGKLSRMEREVFVLRFFDQLSIKDIAEVLVKSESTIKTHLYRSLLKLKKEPSIRQLREEGIS